MLQWIPIRPFHLHSIVYGHPYFPLFQSCIRNCIMLFSHILELFIVSLKLQQ